MSARLTKADLSYIEQDLRKRGLVYTSLQSELLDHISCEVEALMEKGTSFKKSYDIVLAQLRDENLSDLQNETLLSDNPNNLMLLRNNFKIMMRTMTKHGSYTIINIAGLAIGLLCFTVIALYVHHELQYDKIFSKHEQIYRITMSSSVGGIVNHTPTSLPTFAPYLQDNLAGVKDVVRIINYKYSRLSPTMKYGDNIYYEDRVIIADSSFFSVFDFPFIQGNPEKAMVNPNSVVITRKMAEKYFENGSAIGKVLNFNNKVDLEVSGVIENPPSNTHLQFDFVIPMGMLNNTGIAFGPQTLESWNMDWFWTYMIIPKPKDVPVVEASINAFAKGKADSFENAKFYIQSLNDIHLHSDFAYGTDMVANGDILNLYIFIAMGFLILLISCINFINISMATATTRFKEIGISKVMGALRSQLRLQFIGESALISIFSLAVSLLLLQLTLPLFNALLGVQMSVSTLMHSWLILLIGALTVMVGILSGLYPAFFISSLDPQHVLKGGSKTGLGKTWFRSTLVGVQVSISIFLITGTLVVYNQLTFINNKDLGFHQEDVVMLTIRGTAIPKKYYAFKQALENYTNVISVTSVSEPVGREAQFMSFKVEGQTTDQMIKILNVGYDFAETMGLQLAAGRDFSKDVISDSVAGFMINEAAAKQYGWKDPVGKTVKHAFWPGAPEGHVVGVFKDFNFEPLQNSIEPLMVFKGAPAWYVAVRIKTGDVRSTMQYLDKTWKTFEPDKPMNANFLDQSIRHVYEKDERVGNVFFVFSIISIFTAVLGLLGLVSFIIRQRMAEIGLRKILGASVTDILMMMTRHYLILVIIAFVAALPLTYLIMNKWLESFAFRIPFDKGYFFIAFLLVAAIVSFTVIARAWSAARMNPTEVLRGGE